MDKFKKYGFTLAEVLVTLGVIGIVAALTMPTLMANHQKPYRRLNLKRHIHYFIML
ncbi:MAG: type II secretion system protein [Candidatus Gastranaerophilaceae bacterium]